MNLCKYAKVTGCTECTIPFHCQCKKFLQIHARWLMRKLLKDKNEAFKYEPVKDAEMYDVICTKNSDKAKSVALQFALQKNEEVIPFTSNVAMDLVTRKMDIEACVVYLHVTQAVGEPKAIEGMLESFIDWVVKDGGKVAVFMDNVGGYSLKYKSLEGEVRKK